LTFLTQNELTYANFCHNIGFWEKRQFFAENWQKSQKIVIITSTPDTIFLLCEHVKWLSITTYILILIQCTHVHMYFMYICNCKGSCQSQRQI
jgi:hypothetical protein